MSKLQEMYRNAIDLNRYSNGISRRLIRAYNDVMLDAVDQLRGIDELASPVKAARLRAILAQVNDSLSTWSATSIDEITREFQGLAVLQSEFSAEQLQKALPAGAARTVRTVEISPSLAQAIVTSQPTAAGVVDLSDSFLRVASDPITFQLTVGQQVSLPNGEVLREAFRNLSSRQSELFSLSVRNGILEGQSIESIVRSVKGRLNREQRGSIDTIIAAGGQATSIPNNQIRAIVRTSVNQVSVAADRIVAADNPDLTKKYRYTATLDTKTSAICRALDGEVFIHGKGPYPPQHYNCRSRYVNIPSGLEKEFKNIRDDYGEWLNDQNEATKKDVLGPGRLAMWDGLVKKYGANDAIKKFVKKDGSELTLEQLRSRYFSGQAS